MTDSIHRAAWPTADELLTLVADHSSPARTADEAAYQWATDVLFEVRKQRSEAKQPLKVPITRVTIRASSAELGLLPIVEADLRAALRVQAFEAIIGEPREILVAAYDAV